MTKEGTVCALLIEDNPGDARLTEELLREARRADFHLEHVDTLAEGLTRVTREEPEAVLLDLGLPDSQGLEGLLALREKAPYVPVVVLTGLGDEEMGIEAVKHGAQDYLLKGELNSTLLARSLRYAIERMRVTKELQQYQDHLEELVRERTERLRTLVNGMAGREVRMAELKKVIRQLRAQLEEAGLEPVANDPLLE
jgi:DNA-binding response OmpR family regulator